MLHTAACSPDTLSDVNLVVVVPSRARPGNARRLAAAFRQTADFDSTDLVFAVNDDDPDLRAYQELSDEDPWAGLTVVPEGLRVGPILNAVTAAMAPFSAYLGFMGDDHLPRTAGWDKALCAALDGEAGVAYGNDLHQGENLPTACVISSLLVRTLGFFVPPTLEHLYLDDFWKLLGVTTRLAYRPDVIIEHLHPEARKAPVDETYRQAGLSQELMAADGLRWQQWLWQEWPACYDRPKKVAGA